MLTPPKWHSVWLKSQLSSKNISKKTMFFKQADSLFDELKKCCNSTSKDLTLEALSCWRIWIENQQEEDWKENEICYAAVRPLLTKKFHPLHRDVEVSETKLSLMWLALQKTQGLMHLEGPQHILEVFIQSCLSWLSCSDEIGSNMDSLILRILRSLFSKDIEVQPKNEKFPPLHSDIWKSNKLFCRLVTLMLEILQNWTKIKEKTDLLCIWKHFLDHCEQSFKLIPVAVWHKIFKLVEGICSDQEELMRNKMSLLHKCATSLKSVLANSKFIDCGLVLTTPAEALFKIVIELCVNNKDENIPFHIFQYCIDIIQDFSNCIIHTFGYEFCIHMLSKIEDIESKPLLWGLWCGLANCFRQQVNYVNRENYSKMELKLYRKLRSVAANFDLDRTTLEERSVLLIQDHLNFLRVPTTCTNWSEIREKSTEENTAEVPTSKSESPSPGIETKDEFSGVFGFSLNSVKSCFCLGKTEATDTSMETDESEDVHTTTENQKICLNCRIERCKKAMKVKKSWVIRHCGLNNLISCSNFWCRYDSIQNERLITLHRGHRRHLFTPICLTLLLEELCNIAQKGDPSTENFVDKVRKVQTKVKEGEIATPIKLFVSLKGNKGIEFYSNAVIFWNDLDEIVNDVDLLKNLNGLKTKNNSVVRLSMFFFLVNFAKNLFFEERENGFDMLRKLHVDEEEVLTERIVSFMRKVTHYKNRLTNFAFLDNMNRVLPTKSDNPLIVWTNFMSARHSKVNENDNSVSGDISLQESCSKTANDNLINIFNCFDEFESKMSKDNDLPTPKSVKRKGKRTRGGNKAGRFSLRCHSRSLVTPLTKEVKIVENESVTVVQAPPDVFRSVSFSEWRPETVVGGNETTFEKSPMKKRRNSKSMNVACEAPRKRTRRSSENKTQVSDIQDENVNIENRKADAAAESPGPRKKVSTDSPISPRAVYSLRKRPLQRPSKFNDMKCLLPVDTTKGKTKNCEADKADCCVQSACDCATPESRDIKPLKGSESDVMAVSSDSTAITEKSDSEMLVPPVEEDAKESAVIKTEKLVVTSDVKDECVEIKKQETDLDSENHKEISELLDSLIEKIEKAEDSKVNCVNIKIEPVERVDVCDTSPAKTKNNRGMKRRWKTIDDVRGGKKLKTEADAADAELEQEEEEQEEATVLPKPTQKTETLIIQSRGSRMLALIPESPKLNGFHDSSLSKHQTMKPPNVMRNSRASRMLALLPELQEPSPSGEAVRETVTEKTVSDDDNTKKGLSGYTVVIMHHLTPSRKGSSLTLESPKGSPLRQRRSIRFDDDRNETVTYFTDSPPCQTIKQGMKFRGSDK